MNLAPEERVSPEHYALVVERYRVIKNAIENSPDPFIYSLQLISYELSAPTEDQTPVHPLRWNKKQNSELSFSGEEWKIKDVSSKITFNEDE